jgi:hypothetical protein
MWTPPIGYGICARIAAKQINSPATTQRRTHMTNPPRLVPFLEVCALNGAGRKSGGRCGASFQEKRNADLAWIRDKGYDASHLQCNPVHP